MFIIFLLPFIFSCKKEKILNKNREKGLIEAAIATAVILKTAGCQLKVENGNTKVTLKSSKDSHYSSESSSDEEESNDKSKKKRSSKSNKSKKADKDLSKKEE
jgi:hypothetical protein